MRKLVDQLYLPFPDPTSFRSTQGIEPCLNHVNDLPFDFRLSPLPIPMVCSKTSPRCVQDSGESGLPDRRCGSRRVVSECGAVQRSAWGEVFTENLVFFLAWSKALDGP